MSKLKVEKVKESKNLKSRKFVLYLYKNGGGSVHFTDNRGRLYSPSKSIRFCKKADALLHLGILLDAYLRKGS